MSVIARCKTIITRSESAYLATLDSDGFPCIRAMVNLHNPAIYPGQAHTLSSYRDELTAIFSTLTTSDKVKHIRANPRVSVYYCVPSEFLGLTLLGEMEIIEDDALKEAVYEETWRVYYPGGPLDRLHTLMRLKPAGIKGWQGTEKFEFKGDALWKS